MPSCRFTGFSSALCIPITPTNIDNNSNNHNNNSQNVHWIPTHAQDSITTTCFIQLPDNNNDNETTKKVFRVYFQRDFKLLPPQTQTGGGGIGGGFGDFDNGVFAAFLTMNEPKNNSNNLEGTRIFYKCFGKVRQQLQQEQDDQNVPPWFIEGQFSTNVPKTLKELKDFNVELKICKATLKPGFQIGDGLLEPESILSIEETPCSSSGYPGFLTSFKFYYAKKEELDLLGFKVTTPTPPTPQIGLMNQSNVSSNKPIVNPPVTSIVEFLRKSNSTLIKLLDKEQKKRFIETINDWKEIKEVVEGNTSSIVVGGSDKGVMNERKIRIGEIWKEVLENSVFENKEEQEEEEEEKEKLRVKDEDEDSVMLERRRSLRNRD
ncbi:hypothetical protein JCM3765_002697 [Sporobolomyces pararoseus]